jgi:hypothetical protein
MRTARETVKENHVPCVVRVWDTLGISSRTADILSSFAVCTLTTPHKQRNLVNQEMHERGRSNGKKDVSSRHHPHDLIEAEPSVRRVYNPFFYFEVPSRKKAGTDHVTTNDDREFPFHGFNHQLAV